MIGTFDRTNKKVENFIKLEYVKKIKEIFQTKNKDLIKILKMDLKTY